MLSSSKKRAHPIIPMEVQCGEYIIWELENMVVDISDRLLMVLIVSE
jgi:hypothetical protein